MVISHIAELSRVCHHHRIFETNLARPAGSATDGGRSHPASLPPFAGEAVTSLVLV
jgi:hypothetical protein